uniref:Uncharacterized protein n=1 Tax=Elphidium margaritaceum TaxID=933848 RepID=A0A7S0TDG4_9EUKA|mmetsp:Transcript_1136/g.2201  ORF Transcript_1136/g.2201 Transcript_1136/m.2201 type:complete len:248 (+) Transcript_1136:84-827(+)
MGIEHSDKTKRHSCGNNPCNCFAHDHNVGKKTVTRLAPWNSTETGDTPMLMARVVQEACYVSNELLLAKPICSDWYRSYFAASPVFNIGVICTHSRLVHSLHSKLKDTSLPSLNRTPPPTLPRFTCFVDSLMFSINLKRVNANTSHHDLPEIPPHAYVVLMTDHDNILNIYENINKRQQTDVVVLIRIKTEKSGTSKQYQDTGLKQLRAQCNICCVDLSLDSEDSIKKLPLLLVKYYWFKKMQHTLA